MGDKTIIMKMDEEFMSDWHVNRVEPPGDLVQLDEGDDLEELKENYPDAEVVE